MSYPLSQELPTELNPTRGLRPWVRRKAIPLFFVGAYLWAWLVWAYWVPSMSADGLEMTPGFLAAAIAGGLAPTIAAFAVLAIGEGRKGAAGLLRQALRWRAPVKWYAFALLTVPVVTVLSLALQDATFGAFEQGDIAALLPIAIGWPVMAAIGEEFGWRGFALPRLQARWGALAAALVIGVAWGFWHLPADYIGLKGLGWWFIPAFLVNGPLVLIAHSIIMTWLYNRSGRVLPLMLVYHFTITSTAILTPAVVGSSGDKVLSPLITAAGLWAIALGLIVFRRRDFAPAEAAG